MASVQPLDRTRILRALPRRSRYQYVKPRVEAVPAEAGGGWKVVSPNCSRNIDPDGGEIDIAWLEPLPGAGALWHLHAREHAQGVWRCVHRALPLPDALALLCADPGREFWP